MIDTAYAVPDTWRRARVLFAGIGVVFAVLAAIGAFLDWTDFMRAYLTAFSYWTTIALGSLGLLMVQHLSGGVWGGTIRRLLEAGASSLPFLGLLSIPILIDAFIGDSALYPWAKREVREELHLLAGKEVYLNEPFFAIRVVLYFVLWSALAFALTRWSRRLDETADPEYKRRMTRLSAPGMILFVLTVTFASVDLVMSLEPEWYSSIFGVIFGMSGALAMLALSILTLAALLRSGTLAEVLEPEHFHDIGNLMLAVVIFWTYVSFAQFLIIWSGNLPAEAQWYVHRLKGGWEWVSLGLFVLEFFLPFLILLSRGVKRTVQRVVPVAVLIMVMQYVHALWLTKPSYEPTQGNFALHPLDFVLPLAIGGLWMAWYLWWLGGRPVLPLHVLPTRHPRALHTELEHNVAH